MEFQSSMIGLIIIIISWILQLIYSKKGEIRKRFIIFYGLGTAVLVIFNMINNDKVTGILNLFILGLVCAVLIKVSKIQLDKIESKNKIKKKRR
ncbi:MAG: hypothetical protein QXW97_04475 [Candidatus Pacearchaeota archaeon]